MAELMSLGSLDPVPATIGRPNLPPMDLPQPQPNYLSPQRLPEQKTGFGPSLIAILAALKGDFGPSFQIEEQKRKTGVYQRANELVNATEVLIRQGRTEEAAEYFNKNLMALGPRSAEISPYLQLVQRDVNKYREWDTNKNATIGFAEYQASQTQDKELAGKWKGLAKYLKSETRPISPETLSNLVGKELNPEQRVLEGQVIRTTPTTTSTEAIPQVFTPAMLGDKESVALIQSDPEVIKQFGGAIDSSTMTNIMRADDPRFDNHKQVIVNAIARAGAQRYVDELAKQVPIDPAMTSAALAAGGNPLTIARRGIGSESIASSLGTGLNILTEKQRAVQGGALAAQSDVPPEHSGKAALDVRTGQRVYGLSQNVVNADPELGMVPESKVDAYQDLITLKWRLNEARELVNSLPKEGNIGDRISYTVALRLNRIFNVDSDMSYDDFIRTVADDAIETLVNLTGKSAKRYEYLKKPLVGVGATMESFQKSFEQIQRMIDQQYEQKVLKNKSSLPTRGRVEPESIPSGQVISPQGVTPMSQETPAMQQEFKRLEKIRDKKLKLAPGGK